MTIRRFRRLSVACALLLSVGARGVEMDTERTFAVSPGCTLQLDSYRGAVFVEESDAPEVRVRLHVEADADTDEEAARMRAELQLDITAENNVVRIVARNRRENGVYLDLGDRRPLDLHYRITVPRVSNLQLKVRMGSVTVGNLVGRMAAEVEEGSIFFRRIDGTVHAVVQTGDIIVSRCTGDLTARVLQGIIRVGTIGGRAELKNSTGPIEVLTAKGAVHATAQAGDIVVGFARAIHADSRLSVSGGNLEVTLDPEAACRLDASSVWGRVRTPLPLVIEQGGAGKSRLIGRLNGGGPVLSLRASGGHVRILPGDVPFDDS